MASPAKCSDGLSIIFSATAGTIAGDAIDPFQLGREQRVEQTITLPPNQYVKSIEFLTPTDPASSLDDTHDQPDLLTGGCEDRIRTELQPRVAARIRQMGQAPSPNPKTEIRLYVAEMTDGTKLRFRCTFTTDPPMIAVAQTG